MKPQLGAGLQNPASAPKWLARGAGPKDCDTILTHTLKDNVWDLGKEFTTWNWAKGGNSVFQFWLKLKDP